jgi:hypothetical protein
MSPNDMVMVNDELERIWNEAVWSNLTYYPGICLKELRKTTKDFSQYSLSLGRNLNPEFPNTKREC